MHSAALVRSAFEIAREHQLNETATAGEWICHCAACRRLRSSIRGGQARARSFTRAYQRKARSQVKTASLIRSGKAGAAATRTKYGADFQFSKWREWKLKNPSRDEMIIIGILNALKIKYEREYRLGQSLLTLDFYLPQTGQGIEYHGKVHHTLDDQGERAARDRRKRSLLKEQGIETLWIDYTEMADAPAVIKRIKHFTKGKL